MKEAQRVQAQRLRTAVVQDPVAVVVGQDDDEHEDQAAQVERPVAVSRAVVDAQLGQ